MQYIALSLLALAARVAHASAVDTNDTQHDTLVEVPAYSGHPVPWPMPGFPEGGESSSIISVPAEPTPPAAAAGACEKPQPSHPTFGGIPHFDEPHAPKEHPQPEVPHIGPGILPVPIPFNDAPASYDRGSMAALALGVAAMVFSSL